MNMEINQELWPLPLRKWLEHISARIFHLAFEDESLFLVAFFKLRP